MRLVMWPALSAYTHQCPIGLKQLTSDFALQNSMYNLITCKEIYLKSLQLLINSL